MLTLLARDISNVTETLNGHFGWVAVGVCERDTVEVLAHVTAANWRHVEHNQQYNNDEDTEQQTDNNSDQLKATIRHVERYERHQCKGQQQAEHEAEQVCIVVNHRQKSDEEQDQHITGQLENLYVRTTNDVEVVDDLDEQTG